MSDYIDCKDVDQPVAPIVPPAGPGGGGTVPCDCDSLNAAISAKQDRLVAGTGITISGSVISATGGGGGGTTGVSSFNGRSGAVLPQTGDYTASMVRASDGKTVQQYVDEYRANQPDTVMSGTSTKAVQNKVIKAYADAIDRKTLPAGGTSGAVLVKTDNTNYNSRWAPASDFMMTATYDPNRNGRVDHAEASDALEYGVYKASAPALNSNTTVVVQSQVNATNGVAPLDANKKVPLENLPAFATSGLTYGGVFNANTKVATLTPAAKTILGTTSDTVTLVNTASGIGGYVANKDLYYIVNTAGSFAGKSFVPNDTLLSVETAWDKLNGGYAGVTSVNNKTGVVSLTTQDVPQGTTNLYMTQAEKNKLSLIENQATRDVNVIQTAAVTTLADGTKVLRLTNKNGTVTTFESTVPEGDFLTKTGNASNTYLVYSPAGRRDAFTGGEATAIFARKVVDWLNALETVAFTGDYNDLRNKPTRLSQFINDGDGVQPFVTKTTTQLLNYYLKTEVYTKQEVEDLLAAMDSFNFIVVNTLPTTGNTNAIYYVPRTAPDAGYDRYQYIQGRWVHLGTTDIEPDNYLEKTGDASNTTSTLGTFDSRQLLAANSTLAENFGKINKWLADLKDIAFTASWHDLTDAAELATQDDLENYVLKHWDLSQAGKALVVGNDGVVTTQSIGDSVVRKGTGLMSVVGNDHTDNRMNDAEGEFSSSFGYRTIAKADYQSVRGSCNEEDTAGAYIDIVGIGTDDNNRLNGYTLNKQGKGYFYGGAGASAGYTPATPTDFTTKQYVDDAVANSSNLKKQVVTRVPSVAAASENIIYLLQDPDDPDVYQQWMKILIGTNPDVYDMVQVGSTATDMTDYQLKEPGDLQTTAPSVSCAINELLGMIGDLTDLETSVKTDVVSAINSIKGGVVYKTLTAGENVRDYADGIKEAYCLSVPAGTAGNPSSTSSTILSIPTSDKNYYYQFGMSGNVSVYFRRQPKAYAAEIGWTQMSVESLQQTTMPTPETALDGKVYQYTGPTNAQYRTGVWYKCEGVSYAAWLEQNTAITYYTKAAAPSRYDMIYSATFAETPNRVDTVDGIIMTDTDGDRYTRNAASDTSTHQWVSLQLHTSDLINDGNGTGAPNDYFVTRANALAKQEDITEVTDTTTVSKVVPETGDVSDVTAKKIFEYMWKKIYPVGSIYTTVSQDNPGTLFGGTWTLVGTDRVLWGVAQTTAAGQTLDEQLPDIRGHIDWATGGQAKTEISSGTGAFSLTNKNLGAAYPTGTGASNSARGFDFRASYYKDVYKLNASVRPNAYTVHFWRRTA